MSVLRSTFPSTSTARNKVATINTRVALSSSVKGGVFSFLVDRNPTFASLKFLHKVMESQDEIIKRREEILAASLEEGADQMVEIHAEINDLEGFILQHESSALP